MGLHEDIFADTAAASLLAVQGRTVTLQHPQRDPVIITAIVDPVREREVDDIAGRTIQRVRLVRMADDPAGPFGGEAALDKRFSFLIDGVAWRIEGIEHRAPGMIAARCLRHELIEHARGGFRK